MTGQQLKNAILQAAIQGQLVSNSIPYDEPFGEDLLNLIKYRKESIYKDGLERKSTKIARVESLTDYIFEIPEKWIWCRLGDLCHIAGRIGFRGYTKADIVSSGGAISLSPSNIIDGFITFSHYTMISMEKYDESPEIKVRDGEIVFTKTASVGKCAYIDKVPMPTTINPQMVVMKHIGCDARYLTFALQSPYAFQNYNAFIKGTSIPTFSQAVLESLLIPLPPLSIQKAIVEKIEELLPLVDEYDKSAGELESLNKILPDKLRKSVLQEAIHGTLVSNDIPEGEATGAELLQQILKERQEKENKEKGKKAKKLALSTIDEEPWELPDGWCWCKLDDICVITAGQSPDGNDINEQEGVEFHQGKIYFGDIYLKKANIFTKYVTKLAHKDSLLLCMRAPVGIVNITPREICIGRGLSSLESYGQISSLFLCYWLRGYKNYYEDRATGSTFKAITVDIVKQTPIPLPPLSIQHRIVEKIEELFSEIEKLQA